MKPFILTVSIFTAASVSAQQTNFHFSHTDSTRVSPDKIWQVWVDVPNWKQWDKGLKDAVLFGNFQIGAEGKLIPDKGPKSKFIISDLTPSTSYTLKTRIPFGWLVIKRTLEVKNGTTFFCMRLSSQVS